MGFRNQPFACESPADAVAQMISRVRATASTCAAELVALAHARGRILAEPIRTDRDSPPFNTSAMDGYAIRTSDLAAASGGSLTLEVAGEVRIGGAPGMMPEARAVRIVTGAAIPVGCDAVIKREDVIEESVEGGVRAISIHHQSQAKVRGGDHIRPQAENAHAGSVVIAQGARLTAAAIGALAAVGCASAPVCSRVRAAIITTGDEVVAPCETPGPFQIRNSNGPAVAALLGGHAWIDPIVLPHTPDNDEALSCALRDALAIADAIIITGGISMGHRDGVRSALDCLSADVLFHGLPQRPGKPMLGGFVGDIPIFALPGNPLSALVTCTRIVIPVLTACSGATAAIPIVQVALATPDGKKLQLWWHRLVRINAQGMAELAEGRGSGDMIAAGTSDGFIEIPPNAPESERYAFYPWST